MDSRSLAQTGSLIQREVVTSVARTATGLPNLTVQGSTLEPKTFKWNSQSSRRVVKLYNQVEGAKRGKCGFHVCDCNFASGFSNCSVMDNG
jgi:hypothetical protein